MNKKFLLGFVAIASAFAFMPAANAQTASSESTGAVVDFADGPGNAAAAVLVEYTDGSVSALSASSAFGKSGAAATADSASALSVGSSVGVGTILNEVSSDGNPFEGTYVNFGTSPSDLP